MRDPDLVTRAQRAAVALERAWERWRAMHGLSAEPMPPVSSYVGYSIEEPWGRPRVVFGVDAREAELLAALLDHHECVGPFYQADPAEASYGPGVSGNTGGTLDEARPRIPAQAQAAEEEQPRRDERHEEQPWQEEQPWHGEHPWQEEQPWHGEQPWHEERPWHGQRPWHDERPPHEDQPRQRHGQGASPAKTEEPDDAAAGPDGDELRFPGRSPAAEPGGENGAEGLTGHDDADRTGRAGDQRRGRRAELGRPSRRERRAASRQRSSGAREPAAEPAQTGTATPRTDVTGQGASSAPAGSAPAWPAGSGGPARPDWEALAVGSAVPDRQAAGGGGAAGIEDSIPGTSLPADITTIDVIPVIDDAATRSTRPGESSGGRDTQAKSFYDVTMASRERRARGAGQAGAAAADRREGESRDLGRGEAEEAGRGEKASGEPLSLNGFTDAGTADAGTADGGHPGDSYADGGYPGDSYADGGYPGDSYADGGYPGAGHPNGGLAGPGSAQAGLAGLGLAAADLGDPDRSDPDPAEAAGDQAAQRAGGDVFEMEPGYLAAPGPDFPADAADPRTGDDRWADTDPGLGYADDPDLDYAGDTDRDYPGDGGWDDLAGQDDSWDAGPVTAAGSGQDRGLDPGRSDVAGLDQLWDIGRNGPAGHDHGRDAAGQQARDAGRDDAAAPQHRTGPGGIQHASAAGSGPGSAHDVGPGPAPAAGLARGQDALGLSSAGRGPAWDSSPAPKASSARDTFASEDAAPARRELPRDFGPDPLDVGAGRAGGDLLAAPPGGSILTTAPRQEARTARPAVATETIAAELAGWAAGELPGQASARLAAWAAIGGVPAAGYRRNDSSDVGAAGVGTERVR